MIALGLTVELVATVLVVLGVTLEGDGTGVLWSSIAVVLIGLAIAVAGVRRVRPPWPGRAAAESDAG